MSAVTHLEVEPRPIPSPSLPLPELLNKLRFLALDCRCNARLDLHKACDLLDPNDQNAAEAYATALIRTFGQALGRSPSIRLPGSEPSFDESWLIRLIDRAQHNDDDSLSFLLLRHIQEGRRHAFLHLINGLAKRLPDL